MFLTTQKLIHALISGNPLNCNCRLSWIYILRNETRDSTLKHALDKITCITEPTSDRRLNDKDGVENDNDNEDNYEYYDKTDDYGEKYKSKTSKAVKLIDIPLETLPCPKELMQSVEESYGHPIQNEIRLKAFSVSDKITPSLLLIVTLAIQLF